MANYQPRKKVPTKTTEAVKRTPPKPDPEMPIVVPSLTEPKKILPKVAEVEPEIVVVAPAPKKEPVRQEFRASLCDTCIHKHVGQPNCDAFEKQIPMGFLSGIEQHLTPVEGDSGIVYKLNTFL